MMMTRQHSPVSQRPRAGWSGATVFTVFTLLLMLPPVFLWGAAAMDAREHLSERGWQANHELRLELERWALLIGGAPVVGALLGALLG